MPSQPVWSGALVLSAKWTTGPHEVRDTPVSSNPTRQLLEVIFWRQEPPPTNTRNWYTERVAGLLGGYQIYQHSSEKMMMAKVIE